MANRVLLEKLHTETPQEVRDARDVGKDQYYGIMFFGPTVGKSFSFFRDDKEYMHTSEVKEIQYMAHNIYEFKTRNSKYRLTIGEQQEPM